jgi:hypothetical protein
VIVTVYLPDTGPLRVYNIEVPNPSIARGMTVVLIVMLKVWPRAALRSDAIFGWIDHCTVCAPAPGTA